MAKTLLTIFPFLIFLPCSIRCQSQVETLLTHYVQDYAENDEELNIEELREELEYFIDHPIDLNEADLEQLSRIVLISQSDCIALLRYRDEYGPFESYYELVAVDGISATKAMDLSYVTVLEKPKIRKSLRIKSALVSSLTVPGEIEEGTPFKVRLTLDLDYGSMHLRVVADQDKGERFQFDRPIYGFDHYSGSLMWNPNRILQHLVIGSYKVDFGNGNLHSSSTFNSKTSGLGNNSSAFRIVAIGQSAESGYYQGFATMSRFMGFTSIVAGSMVARDGSIDTLDRGISINYAPDGYHTTESSMKRRGALLEANYILGFGYTSHRIRAGLLESNYYVLHRESQAQITVLTHSAYIESRWDNMAVRWEGNGISNHGYRLSCDIRFAFSKGVSARITASHRSEPQKWLNDFLPNCKMKETENLYMGLEMKPQKDWRIITGLAVDLGNATWGRKRDADGSYQVCIAKEGQTSVLVRLRISEFDPSATRATLKIAWQPMNSHRANIIYSHVKKGDLGGVFYRFQLNDYSWVGMRYYVWNVTADGESLYAWVNDVPGLGRSAAFSHSGSQMGISTGWEKGFQFDLGLQAMWDYHPALDTISGHIASCQPSFELSLRLKY